MSTPSYASPMDMSVDTDTDTHTDIPDFTVISDNLSSVDDWELRYTYLIELGRALPPMEDALKTPENMVPGCISQVWFVITATESKVLQIHATSDALIVRGLIAIILSLFNGKTPHEACKIDVRGVFSELGLDRHLSVGRRNGLESMLARVQSEVSTLAKG